MYDDLEQSWHTVEDGWKKDIDAQYIKTEETLEKAWDGAVTCEIENPCCIVSETVWDNLNTQINEKNRQINEKKQILEELLKKRVEMEEECPNVEFPETLE